MLHCSITWAVDVWLRQCSYRSLHLHARFPVSRYRLPLSLQFPGMKNLTLCRMEFGTFVNGNPIIPALWQSLWNSLVQLGVIAGALANSWFQDRLGRRWAFRTGAVIAAIGKKDLPIALVWDALTDFCQVLLCSMSLTCQPPSPIGELCS